MGRDAVATFVLVHGGGHGGWCYGKVKRLLEADGHEVFAPSLTGLAERSHLLTPDVGLDTHITDVVSLLHHWDLREVVLVGHSYGGMVVTGVADRATERIGALVYLDAANPRNGQSLVDVAGPTLELARPHGSIVDGVELVLLPVEGAGVFYGVADPDDLAWMDERLTAHPWRTFEDPLVLTNEDELWAVPQFHIICEANILTRGPHVIEPARAEGRLWTIDTGHDLMITEPEFVAGALIEIAELATQSALQALTIAPDLGAAASAEAGL
jgi:pimeloyl-ACP methyl ester carboxylesterase